MYGLGGFESLSLSHSCGESWDLEQAGQIQLHALHAGIDIRRIVSADAESEQQTLLQATQANSLSCTALRGERRRCASGGMQWSGERRRHASSGMRWSGAQRASR
jgi:hypothetical protein